MPLVDNIGQQYRLRHMETCTCLYAKKLLGGVKAASPPMVTVYLG
jgi:hypothetical protein